MRTTLGFGQAHPGLDRGAGHSGLGLEAQQAAVRAFAATQGWALAAEFSDIASGKDDRRPGFQAALLRCRLLGGVLAAARLDRITRRAHTLSQLLEDGISIRAADMPGADDLMMRIYAAMAQKERELILERTREALAAAKARGKVLGGDRGYRPAIGPDTSAAAWARRQAEGAVSYQALARLLRKRGVPAPSGGSNWMHTTVARVMGRVGAQSDAPAAG